MRGSANQLGRNVARAREGKRQSQRQRQRQRGPPHSHWQSHSRVCQPLPACPPARLPACPPLHCAVTVGRGPHEQQNRRLMRRDKTHTSETRRCTTAAPFPPPSALRNPLPPTTTALHCCYPIPLQSSIVSSMPLNPFILDSNSVPCPPTSEGCCFRCGELPVCLLLPSPMNNNAVLFNKNTERPTRPTNAVPTICLSPSLSRYFSAAPSELVQSHKKTDPVLFPSLSRPPIPGKSACSATW